MWYLWLLSVVAEAQGDQQARTSSRQSERHQKLQQTFQEELKQRLDTNKQRQGEARSSSTRSNVGTASQVPNPSKSTSNSEYDDYNRLSWDAQPRRKAPPPPTRRPSYQLHHHRQRGHHLQPHHGQYHHQQRRNSVRYNSMLGQTHGQTVDERREQADQQTSLYTEFPTVTVSQHK